MLICVDVFGLLKSNKNEDGLYRMVLTNQRRAYHKLNPLISRKHPTRPVGNPGRYKIHCNAKQLCLSFSNLVSSSFFVSNDQTGSLGIVSMIENKRPDLLTQILTTGDMSLY